MFAVSTVSKCLNQTISKRISFSCIKLPLNNNYISRPTLIHQQRTNFANIPQPFGASSSKPAGNAKELDFGSINIRKLRRRNFYKVDITYYLCLLVILMILQILLIFDNRKKSKLRAELENNPMSQYIGELQQELEELQSPQIDNNVNNENPSSSVIEVEEKKEETIIDDIKDQKDNSVQNDSPKPKKGTINLNNNGLIFY